ncbi:MAG TPA: hypothetical protein VN822_06005 [Candidatus Acidoferrales bacterium]|nr:hypothetical protein [Candidatus Acidoferrales bacterium]
MIHFRAVHFDPHRFLFFLASFGVPAVLVVINLVIRKTKKWYYTTGSDILLALIAFNFSSTVVLDDAKEFIRDPILKAIAIGVFPFLGLVTFGVWIWTVQGVEVKIHKAIKAGRDLSGLQFMIFLSWTAVISFTGLEFLIFIWR